MPTPPAPPNPPPAPPAIDPMVIGEARALADALQKVCQGHSSASVVMACGSVMISAAKSYNFPKDELHRFIDSMMG